jgi:DNA-directed RNA polymerase specialized sigma24 family protein
VFVETAADPYALYVGKVDRERVREAIRQLSVGQREIIMLREYHEPSYQELAGILNCPVGAVMSRLRHANLQSGVCRNTQSLNVKRQKALIKTASMLGGDRSSFANH